VKLFRQGMGRGEIPFPERKGLLVARPVAKKRRFSKRQRKQFFLGGSSTRGGKKPDGQTKKQVTGLPRSGATLKLRNKDNQERVDSKGQFNRPSGIEKCALDQPPARVRRPRPSRPTDRRGHSRTWRDSS